MNAFMVEFTSERECLNVRVRGRGEKSEESDAVFNVGCFKGAVL